MTDKKKRSDKQKSGQSTFKEKIQKLTQSKMLDGFHSVIDSDYKWSSFGVYYMEDWDSNDPSVADEDGNAFLTNNAHLPEVLILAIAANLFSILGQTNLLNIQEQGENLKHKEARRRWNKIHQKIKKAFPFFNDAISSVKNGRKAMIAPSSLIFKPTLHISASHLFGIANPIGLSVGLALAVVKFAYRIMDNKRKQQIADNDLLLKDILTNKLTAIPENKILHEASKLNKAGMYTGAFIDGLTDGAYLAGCLVALLPVAFTSPVGLAIVSSIIIAYAIFSIVNRLYEEYEKQQALQKSADNCTLALSKNRLDAATAATLKSKEWLSSQKKLLHHEIENLENNISCLGTRIKKSEKEKPKNLQKIEQLKKQLTASKNLLAKRSATLTKCQENHTSVENKLAACTQAYEKNLNEFNQRHGEKTPTTPWKLIAYRVARAVLSAFKNSKAFILLLFLRMKNVLAKIIMFCILGAAYGIYRGLKELFPYLQQKNKAKSDLTDKALGSPKIPAIPAENKEKININNELVEKDHENIPLKNNINQADRGSSGVDAKIPEPDNNSSPPQSNESSEQIASQTSLDIKQNLSSTRNSLKRIAPKNSLKIETDLIFPLKSSENIAPKISLQTKQDLIATLNSSATFFKQPKKKQLQQNTTQPENQEFVQKTMSKYNLIIHPRLSPF